MLHTQNKSTAKYLWITSWWCHDMEVLSTLLARCEENHRSQTMTLKGCHCNEIYASPHFLQIVATNPEWCRIQYSKAFHCQFDWLYIFVAYNTFSVLLAIVLKLITRQFLQYISPELWRVSHFNSSAPNAAYMRQWMGPALVQIMACRLVGAKPLSKAMRDDCQLDS